MTSQSSQIDIWSRFEVVREPVRTARTGSSPDFGESTESTDSPVISPIKGGSNHFPEIPNDYTVRTGSPTGEVNLEPVLQKLAPQEGGEFATLPPPASGCSGAEPGDQQIAEKAPEPAADLGSHGAPVLRPYQLAAIAGVQARLLGGTGRTLLVLPTGGGKTVVFAELVRECVARGQRALVLAHRTELLKQAHRKLTDVGVLAGIEKADKRAGHAPVVVASVQTLQGKRLQRLRPSEFGLVVVDEAHHAAATSYRAILDWFAATPTLGVTATPDRADGKALGEVFSSVAYRYELRAAIRDGWLAPIRARRILVDSLDLSSVRTRAGDLAQDDLAKVMATEEVLLGVASPLIEQAGDRKTMVFAVDVANAHSLAEVLNRYRPSCARAIDGTATDEERTTLLRDFTAGRFQFLVNCALFTEGFDEPSVACIAVARPTKSRALYTQMIGRGTRLFPGKADCLVLDFVGNSGRHKLVGPIDALAAGDVTEDVHGEANRMLEDEQLELEDVLASADAELKRQRAAAKLTASAKYIAHEIDPFLGDELDLEPAATFAGCNDPALASQVDEILAAGVKHVTPDLTRGEAHRIIGAIRSRRKAGLSSVKQTALLKRFGVDTRTLTIARASYLIGFLDRNHWNARALNAEVARLATLVAR